MYWLSPYKSIEDTFLASELISEFSFEYESEFFWDFSYFFLFIFWWHLIEDEMPCLREKRFCPSKYLCHICSCSWYYEVILSCVVWIFCEDFCTLLNCSNIRESEFCNKMIHGFNFFAYWVKECYLEFWHDEFERNSWKTSSRSDVEESYVIGLMTSNILRKYTYSIKTIYKVLLYNTICITDRREIGVTIIGHKKLEELLELNKLRIWELETVGCEKWSVHRYKSLRGTKQSMLRRIIRTQNTLFSWKIQWIFDKKKKKKYSINTFLYFRGFLETPPIRWDWLGENFGESYVLYNIKFSIFDRGLLLPPKGRKAKLLENNRKNNGNTSQHCHYPRMDTEYIRYPRGIVKSYLNSITEWHWRCNCILDCPHNWNGVLGLYVNASSVYKLVHPKWAMLGKGDRFQTLLIPPQPRKSPNL